MSQRAMVPLRHAIFQVSIKIKDPANVRQLNNLHHQVHSHISLICSRVIYHARVTYSDDYPQLVVYAFAVERETSKMFFLKGGMRVLKDLRNNRRYSETVDKAVAVAISRACNYLSHSVYRLRTIQRTIKLLVEPNKYDDQLYGVYRDLQKAEDTVEAVENLMDEMGITRTDPRYFHFSMDKSDDC